MQTTWDKRIKLKKLEIEYTHEKERLYKYIDKMIDKNYVWLVFGVSGWILALAMFMKGW